MATDPAPDSKAPAANAPPAMTPYAIAVALLAGPCRYGWSLLSVLRSALPCSSLSTATRACPDVDGHGGPETLRPLGTK
jgi:hypothetical protein